MSTNTGSKEKSVWDLTGNHLSYGTMHSSFQKELDEILEDLKAVYSVYRPIRIKQVIERIEASKHSRLTGTRYGKHGRSSYSTFSEWDLKDIAIIINSIFENENTNLNEIHDKHSEVQEEITIATGYINGLFSNAKMWEGHRKLLSDYRKQLNNGLPMSERQADTLIKILKHYSPQVVRESLL